MNLVKHTYIVSILNKTLKNEEVKQTSKQTDTQTVLTAITNPVEDEFKPSHSGC